MKKFIQILVGCGVSASMLYIAFRDVDGAQLKESFLQIRLWPILPFIALFFTHFYFRSLRWRFLLPEAQGESPSLRKLFDSIILGNLGSFLLPFRLGEFIRPLVLCRWTKYSFASAFISVIMERFFDLSAVLISFFALVQLLPDLPSWLHLAAYSLGGMAIALLVFLVGGCLAPTVISKIVGVCASIMPPAIEKFVVNFTGDLLKGAAVVKTPKRLAAVICLTAGVWVTTYLQFYTLLFIFDLNHSLLLAVTLGVFVALAVALPSAPGFVGVFQVGCVAATTLFAYPLAAAQVYSLVVHALTFILLIAVGFWLLSVHNLNLFELKRAAEEGQQPS
jgi:uncharacterized protein (TIRG00374 family)